MASINGISIKKLKYFKDHEGCTIAQGDIWHNGKKLGFWSQSYMNGPDDFDFDEHILDKEVESYKVSDRVEEKYKTIFGLDTLLYELLPLIDDEKEFKKMVKKGWKSLVKATDGFHYMSYYSPESDSTKIVNDKFHQEFLKKCKKHFFENTDIKVTIYNDLKDFEVKV